METTNPRYMNNSTRNNNFRALLLMCLFFLLPIKNYAQSPSCAGAATLPQGCTNMLSFGGSEVWYSFTAVDTSALIRYFHQFPSTATVETMCIYSGSCATLVLLDSVSMDSAAPSLLASQIGGLTIGSTYLIKLKRSDSCATCADPVYELCLSTPVLAFWGLCVNDHATGTQIGCCIDVDLGSQNGLPTYCYNFMTICAGDSIDFLHDNTNTNYPMGVPYLARWSFVGGSCTGNYIDTTFQQFTCVYSTPGTYIVRLAHMWVDSAGNQFLLSGAIIEFNVITKPSPNLLVEIGGSGCIGDSVCLTRQFNQIQPGYSTFTFNVDGQDYVMCNQFTGCDSSLCFPDAQYNTSFLSGGDHTVILYVENECGIDSTVQIIHIGPIASFTYISGCPVLFFGSATCPQDIAAWSWNFGDPASGGANFANIQNPAHSFTTPFTSYLITLTVTDVSGGTSVFTQFITSPLQPDATISGAQSNNCGTGVLTYNAPCLPGITYTWFTVGAISSNVYNGGCTIDVNWGNNGGYLVLGAANLPEDCSDSDTLFIPACCNLGAAYNATTNPSGVIYINNRTASSVLGDISLGAFVSGSIFSSTNVVCIQSGFIIDVPFTFLNCPSINPGTNAWMEVSLAQTLTIDNSKVTPECDTMWDGIYIKGSTATLNVINNSLLQQAKNSVVSENGGRFFIESSELRNNYKDIIVKKYLGIHQGLIRNTTFTMAGTFLPALPALPFGHNKTVCGIEIIDNADIVIGDATIASYQNRFTNILVGVRSINSKTTIVNSRFANMNPTPIQALYVANAGTGVYATGNKNVTYSAGITVGGLGFKRCVFTNMRVAIDGIDRLNVTISNNNISNISVYGIRIQRSKQMAIKIAENNIANNAVTYGFNTAIQILECYFSVVDIFNNVILQTGTVANQNGVGIHVGLVTPGDMTVNIVGNNGISRVKTGIWLQNLTAKNKVYVISNVINFTKPNGLYTSVHSGIDIENCATIRIRYNRIGKGPGNPNANMRDNLRGVSMENSTVTFIAHNKFTRLGSGVYGWELCGGSSMVCDTFLRCYDGFFFTGGASTGGSCDIGDQVIDQASGNPAPTGCKWTISGNADITGFIQPAINWYRDATPINQTGMNPASFMTGLTVFSPNPSACDLPQYFMQQSPAVERDQNAGQAVFNPGTYSPGTQQGYQGRRNAHRKLKDTPIWMVLGTPQDSLYAGFFMINEQVNIGLFRNFEDMVAVDSVNFAGSILNSIADTNLSESNLKVVYSIYQQTWMQGIYEFTPADSAVLYGIAVQHASDAGEGVYSARVLLGLDVDEYGASGNRYGNPDESSVESVQAMSLYPNPATDQLTINTTLVEGQTSTVIITDLQGKIVMSKNVSVSGHLIIDASTLDNGMYFVQMFVDGVLIETNKLEVIHE